MPSFLQHVVSFGGGVNSTAMLVMLHERGLRPDAILFADTGGERPETYEHVKTVDRWCSKAGFPGIVTVRYHESEHASLEVECLNNETLPSKLFGNGGCSVKWKRRPMNRWIEQWMIQMDPDNIVIKELGGKRPPALVGFREPVFRLIGIHAGEHKRGKIPDDPFYRYLYPLRLADWGQGECVAACERAFGYAPRKSSCFFCPSMRKPEVIALSKEHPDLFRRAVEMERNAKPNLTTKKGLGSHWSWEDLVRADDAQRKLLYDCTPEACDDCMDG